MWRSPGAIKVVLSERSFPYSAFISQAGLARGTRTISVDARVCRVAPIQTASNNNIPQHIVWFSEMS